MTIEHLNTPEVWKAIPDFPNYEISNYGDIKSYSIKSKGKLLKLSLTKKGYLYNSLYKDNKTWVFCRIHRLVYQIFYGEIPYNYNVHHLDGNKLNNFYRNLIIMLSKTHGEIHAGKLNREEANKIRSLYKPGKFGYGQIAKIYGLSKSSIHCIITGKSYKNI